jgi:GMP synthase-like glutamine amidotransferase
MAKAGNGPNILVVLNATGAQAGVLGECILARPGYYLSVAPGIGYSAAAPDEHRDLPDSDAGFDGLVVLGGPQSAGDDEGNPYFPRLMETIREFHAADKPVMGVCLGGQLVARAFGARVYDQGAFDFGFGAVNLIEEGRGDPLFRDMDAELVFMQSHQDVFDVPEDGTLLARDAAGGVQGFRLGRATYAFQFHPEVTADIVREWARRRSDQLKAGDAKAFQRLEAQIRQHMHGANQTCRRLGERWLDLIGVSS